MKATTPKAYGAGGCVDYSSLRVAPQHMQQAEATSRRLAIEASMQAARTCVYMCT
jgi:hypothetical protein